MRVNIENLPPHVRQNMRIGYKHFLGVRLDDLTYLMLNRLTEKLSIDKSEAVRRAIILAYSQFIEKKDPVEVLEKIIEKGEL